MKSSEKLSAHITDFYIEQFVAQSGLSLEPPLVQKTKSLIKAAKADINRGRELLEEINVDFYEKLVVIQPGSGGSHKCWHLDNFLSVAKVLASEGVEVIFLLGPAEMERFTPPLRGAGFSDATPAVLLHKIEVAGAKCLTDLSLMQVLELLSCADAFLGNDSGITHLSAALGIRTVAVFGPTDPAVHGPIGPAVTVLRSNDADFAKKPSASLQQELLNFF